MYELEYSFNGDYEVSVYKIRKARATKRPDMSDLEHELEEKCYCEANKLYRLAWRMIRHGCSKESVEACRREARALDRVGGMNLWRS